MQNHNESTDAVLFFKIIGNALIYFFKNTYTVLSGVMASFAGYLLPIRDMTHLIIGFFIVDVIFGYWAAKKIKKQRFSVKIIWEHTMPRMLISIFLLIGTFLWDKTYEQNLVDTYRIVGWFISGVLLCSIAENGYKITRWSMLYKLKNIINSGIKRKY